MPESPDRPEGDDPVVIAAHRAALVSFHVERLGAIAYSLAEHESRLGLVVMRVEPSRTGLGIPYSHRLADLDIVLGRLGKEAPNFGILVDGLRLYTAREAHGAGLAWGIERIVWVHVADLPVSVRLDRWLIADNDRGVPGENGAVDYRGLHKALDDHGYDGPVIAEPLRAWDRG